MNSFSTQTAVIIQEIIKFCACTIIMIRDRNLGTVAQNPCHYTHPFRPGYCTWFRTICSTLLLVCWTRATYTVSYQTKTIWSGILTVALLNRKLDAHKWIGLVALFAGVGFVQVSNLRGYGDGL